MRNRSTRRSALVALLAAMTYHGTVTAESPENLPVHAYPPLPVESDHAPTSDQANSPRANPYFKLPPAEGLVTLTAGELPEPTLLRPMSSKLTLVPVERDEPHVAKEGRSSTLQLGEPKRNAFARDTASQQKPPAASPASFDRDHQISEADGAITFSFSDASDQAAASGSESAKTSDGKPNGTAADVDDSRRQPQQTSETTDRPEQNVATAILPEQVREASPVQLDHLTVEEEPTNSPVVVSSQRGGAGKEKPTNGTSQRRAKKEIASDEPTPVPTLLRPIEPIIVAEDSSQSSRQQQPNESEATKKVDERKRTGTETERSKDIDRHTVNGAPIVIDRGAIAKIGKRSGGKVVDSPVVTEGSLVVIDVPRIDSSAAPRQPSQTTLEVGRDLKPAKRSAADGAIQPQKDSQSSPSSQPMKTDKAVNASPPKNAPQPEIEHLSTGSGNDAVGTRSATEEFRLANQTAGDVTVATAEVGSISLEKPVHCFAVENSSVCQIMATSATELRIIGQQAGKTRLAVWHGPRESTQPLLYTVRVTAGAKQNQQSLLVAANKLNLILLKTFPGVDVRVTAGEDNLTVHGSAKGDEQARRILRLVRQACLVPVVDEIVVR